VKPFQRSDLVPAIELAVGRFRELRALTEQTKSLEDQLETRKVVDKAKGVLMDAHGFTEADSFTFVQKTAMRDRTTMRAVAESILDGTLTPETP
jgi:response regulator NasT